MNKAMHYRNCMWAGDGKQGKKSKWPCVKLNHGTQLIDHLLKRFG